MNIESALELTKRKIVAQTRKPLIDSQICVLRGSLEDKSLSEIAELHGYNESYIKEVSAKLWVSLTEALGEKVNKKNLISVIEERLRLEKLNPVIVPVRDEENLIPLTDKTPEPPSQNFIGREGAVADLNTRIKQGAKVILIQAPGGVGKTTLAQEYLHAQGFEVVLELPMAKETENITPVESVLEEWLKQDFQEEPGRDFGVTLERLKRQLQTRKVGVLIDNLEPALDGHGKFINPHRRYGELLRVLADPSVKSVTLITSREPLGEGIGGITHYSLPSLNVAAWEDFFSRRDIVIDAPTLQEIHKAYGGNALAMNILCDPIQREGGMVAYWREHKVTEGLLELAVENLIKEQFNRLEKISPEAYRLLCRLGCYRYQNVPTVPIGGLLCLLWDVQETEYRRIIESLRSWSLVQCNNGEFWLHPVIQAESLTRLRKNEHWELSNRNVAKFWKNYLDEIITIEDANIAFEAYYHYVLIKDIDSGIELIFHSYNNDNSPAHRKRKLGAASMGLGLNYEIIYAINSILDKIENFYYLSELHRFLGASYNLLGNLQESINHYSKSSKSAIKYLIKNPFNDKNHLFYRLKRLQLVSLIDISFCLIELGEIEKAIYNVNECLSISELLISELSISEINENSFDFFNYLLVEIYSILPFLKSLNRFQEKASYLAENTEIKLSLLREHSWTRGYGLFFLGLTYKNIGKVDKSSEIYIKVISCAEKYNYTQLKGKSLTGLSELYRLQSKFETALSHHEEAIQLLEKIGAKCDLAEAYYQLALTYQAMGEHDQIQIYFDKAIGLYEDMEAPKQVVKVQQAMSNNNQTS